MVKPPALPASVVRLLRDLSQLHDATDEFENGVRSGEVAFLAANLRSCQVLARQIERQAKGKQLRQLVAKLERTRP